MIVPIQYRARNFYSEFGELTHSDSSWGKRDTSLILPTNSSISVTLNQADLRSLTTARIITAGKGGDRLWLNGSEEVIKAGTRMERCLTEMRALRATAEVKFDIV